MKTFFKIGLVAFVSLFFIKCKDEMVFKNETYTNPNYCTDNNNCLQIKLDILEADEKNPLKDSINFHVFNIIKESLDLSVGEKKIETYVDLINLYESFYEEYKKTSIEEFNEKPENIINWEASALVKLNYQTEYILNFAVENYSFTGGAHGYGASQSLIIDAITGRKLHYKNLFTELDNIKRMAEDKLREKYKIGLGKSLNANGFFFENDKFSLPENIFFNQNGIVLHYNQYEIAPYAFGPIDIELSNKEIGKYLVTKQFKKDKK